ncbi:hypothetical protein MKEN_00369100 [Mycena kentingensis (nom. inval.)]|nr:hypothetical protein MKEN_00369100 [Mycena kentingensis (nom. inval.)]
MFSLPPNHHHTPAPQTPLPRPLAPLRARLPLNTHAGRCSAAGVASTYGYSLRPSVQGLRVFYSPTQLAASGTQLSPRLLQRTLRLAPIFCRRRRAYRPGQHQDGTSASAGALHFLPPAGKTPEPPEANVPLSAQPKSTWNMAAAVPAAADLTFRQRLEPSGADGARKLSAP